MEVEIRERARCLGLSFAYVGDVCDNFAFMYDIW